MQSRSRLLPLAIALVAGVGAGGCDVLQKVLDQLRQVPPPPDPRPCTEIGCSDLVSVMVVPRAGTFPPGNHVLEVSTPAFTPPMTCKFVVPGAAGATAPAPPSLVAPPPAPPPPGNVIVGDCTRGLSVIISPAQRCTTVMRGDAVGQVCEPIPGQFREQITINATPAQLHINQKVDGRVILDRELTPVYREVRPNGPACGPVCRQAQVTELEI